MFGGEYLHADLAAMAAAYLFHIVQNHPFADGNKRTGTQAAIVFLKINGFRLKFSEEATEAMVIEVATGKAGKEHIANFFRNLMREQGFE